MCPACIASVDWIAAGAASTGGLAALGLSRLEGSKFKAIDTIHTINTIEPDGKTVRQDPHESRIIHHESRPY